MILGGKYEERRLIRSEVPNFKYSPLIEVTQNFIFQNGVTEQKSLRSPALQDPQEAYLWPC